MRTRIDKIETVAQPDGRPILQKFGGANQNDGYIMITGHGRQIMRGSGTVRFQIPKNFVTALQPVPTPQPSDSE
jgi:hypothetical protein